MLFNDAKSVEFYWRVVGKFKRYTRHCDRIYTKFLKWTLKRSFVKKIVIDKKETEHVQGGRALHRPSRIDLSSTRGENTPSLLSATNRPIIRRERLVIQFG